MPRVPAHWSLVQRLDHYTGYASASERSAGCWIWLGTTRHGYGQLWHKGQMRGAHRLSWEVRHGPIPEGSCVCHTCDTPRCINPDHLWLGSRLLNNEDRHYKGRTRVAHGERSGSARLTEQAVIAIRASDISQAALARQYGVSLSTIVRVIRRETWAHIAIRDTRYAA